MTDPELPSRHGESEHPVNPAGSRAAIRGGSKGNDFAQDPPQGTDFLPGLHEASNPYWDWLWGSNSMAQEQLCRWLDRANSELSRTRIRPIAREKAVAGCYIAMPGAELQSCRKADLLALFQEVRREPGNTMTERLRLTRGLFAAVAECEFYLSRIWVSPAFRGQGIGRNLLEMALRDGNERGFCQFRLDVATGNDRAIRMYRNAGFIVEREAQIVGSAVSYCSMVRAA